MPPHPDRTRSPINAPLIGVVDRATATAIGTAHALQISGKFRADIRDGDFITKLSSGLIATDNWQALIFDPKQFGHNWRNLLRVMQQGQPELVLVAYGLNLGVEWRGGLTKAGIRAIVDKEEPLDVLPLALQSALAGSVFLSARVQSNKIITPLSPREAEVVFAFASGATLIDIAERISVSRQSIYAYKQRAMAKLNVKTDFELFRVASELGYLD